VLFAASFAHATPDAAEWAKIVEAAKKEGKVVVYSGYVSPNTHKAIGDAFEKNTASRSNISWRAAANCANASASSKRPTAFSPTFRIMH
jgi:hypothetical protein